MKFDRILLFGTSKGILQLLRIIPLERIVGIVAPSIRANEVETIRNIVKEIDRPIQFLIQPTFNSSEYALFLDQIISMNINSIVSNAYSMIIRPCILELCHYNAINIHWSLLPSNRGPNPVQWSLIKGESKTGVTIHYMDDGIDTGDIIAASEVIIEGNDTWVSLSEKLYNISEELFSKTFNSLIYDRNVRRYKQDELKASTNFRLSPQYPEINFLRMSDTEIFNLIRAQVHPLSGAFIRSGQELLYFKNYIDFETVKQLRKQYGG